MIDSCPRTSWLRNCHENKLLLRCVVCGHISFWIAYIPFHFAEPQSAKEVLPICTRLSCLQVKARALEIEHQVLNSHAHPVAVRLKLRQSRPRKIRCGGHTRSASWFPGGRPQWHTPGDAVAQQRVLFLSDILRKQVRDRADV
jgi:hypothetical protein